MSSQVFEKVSLRYLKDDPCSSDAALTDPKEKTQHTSRIMPFNLRYGNPSVSTTEPASRRPRGGGHLRRQLGIFFFFFFQAIILFSFKVRRWHQRGDGIPVNSTPKIWRICSFLLLFTTIRGRNHICRVNAERPAAAKHFAFRHRRSLPPLGAGRCHTRYICLFFCFPARNTMTRKRKDD